MSQTIYHQQNQTFELVDSYQKVKRLLDFESAEKYKILDVGSGSGSLGVRLISLGHVVTGLDVNKEALKFPWVKPCDITQDWNLSPESFNVIICTDTAEHLQNPAHILQQAKKVLAFGGHLIFGVPNHFDLRQRLRMLFGRGIVHWDNIRHNQTAGSYMHLRFFTLADLRLMFERENWQIEKAQYNFMGGGIIPSRLIPGFICKFLLRHWPGLFSGKFIFLLKPKTGQNTGRLQTILIPSTPKGL